MVKGERIDRRQEPWLALIVAALTAVAVIDIADDSRTVPLVLLLFGPLAASLTRRRPGRLHAAGQPSPRRTPRR